MTQTALDEAIVLDAQGIELSYTRPNRQINTVLRDFSLRLTR